MASEAVDAGFSYLILSDRGVDLRHAPIPALYQGQSGTVSVIVTPSVVMSIALTPAAATLALGTSEQLTPTGTFSDGTTQNISAEVTWSSSVTSAALAASRTGTKSAGRPGGRAGGGALRADGRKERAGIERSCWVRMLDAAPALLSARGALRRK